jgi:hypothetical protein
LRATFGAFALAAGAGALLATAPARAADADDEPTATPYRPSVAGGAYLSRPGWLEVEFGAQRLGGRDTDRRDSLPYLLKLALDERWAVLLGGEARVRLAPQGGSTVSGVGDTVATLKYRAPFGGDSAAYGVEASVKLPTARDALGSGERDYGIKGIYSADLRGGFHLDANLGVTRLGGVDAGQGRALSAWAAAVSHPAGDAWTLALDLSGTAQRGAPSTSQLLGAASYSVSKRVVVDFGAARGLTSATPRWTAFSGVTVLLGQLF